MAAYVIVPTYNESENIQLLVPELLGLGEDLHVVVVDDNSPDGTGDLVEAMGREDERVHLIRRAGKLGYASADIAGIGYALERQPEYIIHMDADFSHHPRYIPDMLTKIRSGNGEIDIVVGSRYVPGGGTRNWGLSRILLSRIANLIARNLLALQINDCTSGFRCYRREVIEAFDFSQISVDGYSFLIEMTHLFQQSGARFAQVPIIFEDRLRGKSKISKRIVLEAMGLVLRRWRERVFGGNR